MRHTTRALLSVLAVVGSCDLGIAAESRWGWWPFGEEKETFQTTPTSIVPPVMPTMSPSRPPSAATTPIGPPSDLSQNAPATQASTLAEAPAAGQASFTQIPPPAIQTDRSAESESPFPKFAWPKMHLPEVSVPKPQMPQLWPNREQVDETRNAWAGESPEPEQSSPLQAMRNGAQRVGASTRSAWRKTVDTLTPGRPAHHNTGSQIAQRDIKPPFWKRMFGSEEPKLQGPQTIPQWMAQDRLDP